MIGAEGQNRTADTMIFSHVLYQLSYLGARNVRKTFDYSTVGTPSCGGRAPTRRATR
jgi:hypothetical protein